MRISEFEELETYQGVSAQEIKNYILYMRQIGYIEGYEAGSENIINATIDNQNEAELMEIVTSIQNYIFTMRELDDANLEDTFVLSAEYSDIPLSVAAPADYLEKLQRLEHR